MKAAVFSDTHGVVNPMIKAVSIHAPDAICHLGDHDRDASVLLQHFPSLPVYSVCGNCDYYPLASASMVVEFGQIKAFLTHGHQYHVEYGRIDSLVYAAQEVGANLVLFGHTHAPLHTDIGGVKVVNPGSAGKGKERSWAMLDLFDNGGIGVTFHRI